MKKLLVAALLFATVGMMMSCSTYTCPTYAKTAKVKNEIVRL